MMDHASLFLRFGTAIAIGFLIGLQREFSHGRGSKVIVTGERTFALIGLLGALAAMAAVRALPSSLQKCDRKRRC